MKKIDILALCIMLAVLIIGGVRFAYDRASDGAPVSAKSAAVGGDADVTPVPEQTAANVEMVPDFTVYNADGEEVNLHDYIGKPIVVNFWATWCGPCKSELPAFDKAYREYGDQVEFLMVNLTDGNLETVDGVKQFVADGGYDFPVYFDTMSSAAQAYSTTSIPVTVFVDENGEMVRSFTGAISETILTNSLERMTD